MAGAPAVFCFGEGRVEFLGTWESPGVGAGGMGAEAWSIPFIAHITDEEVFFAVLEVESGFNRAKLHHTGGEAVANEDDV